MNSNALMSTLREVFPIVPVANAERRDVVVYHLLLINYKPIIRRIDGIPYYGFLDLNSERMDLVFRRGFRSTSLGSQTPGAVDRIHLDTLLESYDTPVYAKEIERMVNEPFVQVSSISNTCVYKGVLPEFDAILLNTSDFDILERCVLDQISGTLRINGIDFPTMLTDRRTSKPMPLQDAVRNWYYGYMMEANLQLSEIYTRFMPSRPSVPEIQRMIILNEFVPFMVKFSGIFHPILDTGIFDQLSSRYELFRTLEFVEGTCKYTGQRLDRYFSDKETSSAYYILRGNLQRLLEISIDAAAKADSTRRRGTDMYSPYLYSKMILRTACDSIGLNLFSEDVFPYHVYTIGEGEQKQVITININNFLSYYGVTCEPEQAVDWLTAATYNYVLDRNSRAGDPRTAVEVSRLVNIFRSRLTPLTLTAMEVI